MKVLVVSLLRLGDIFIHGLAINAFKKENPDIKVDLLINKQFAYAEVLIYKILSINNIIYFDRNEIQKSILAEQEGLLRSFDLLESNIDLINSQNYDEVYNLTHNHLSARLLDLISAKRIKGAHYKDLKPKGFEDELIRYINKDYSSHGEMSFHSVDLFKKILGVKNSSTKNSVENVKLNKIVIQAFSAEEKKEWNSQNWLECAQKIRLMGLDLPIYFIAAPQELEKLQSLQTSFVGMKNIFFQTPNLLDVLNLIENSLLITVDTSIKHLACYVSSRILEVSLGSSNPFKTGPYQENSIVLHSSRQCAPCSHSEACPYEHRLCTEDIDPHLVALLSLAIVMEESKNSRGLMNLQIHSVKTNIFRTEMDDLGYWSMRDVSGPQAHDIYASMKSKRTQIIPRMQQNFIQNSENI
jgi:ADP-heptose:LPS heptosyltransferase